MLTKSRIINRFGIVLLTLCFAGCSKPYDGYVFVTRNGSNDRDINRYSFAFDMDSAAVYTTSIACSLDEKMLKSDFIRLKVRAKSPSGNLFEEIVPFPLTKVKNVKIKRHTHYINVEWPYRQNVSTNEAGRWTVLIKPDPSQDDAVLGIGFAYNQTRWERTN